MLYIRLVLVSLFFFLFIIAAAKETKVTFGLKYSYFLLYYFLEMI